MAVTVLTPIRATGSDLQCIEIVWSTALTLDGAEFPMSGNDVILIENIDEEDPCSVTVKSSQDGLGRTGDITMSIPAGTVVCAGAFTEVTGWRQPGGSMLILPATTLLIRVAVIRCPA